MVAVDPGRARRKCRTVAAYARYASLPVTFCSKTARSSRGKTCPVAGIRSPWWVCARRATSGCAAASAANPVRSSHSPAIRSARSTTQSAPGPYPSAVSSPVSGRSASVAGPSGVRVAHQNVPAAIRAHGSYGLNVSARTDAASR